MPKEKSEQKEKQDFEEKWKMQKKCILNSKHKQAVQFHSCFDMDQN
jgi:hypothetical protein